MDGDASLDETVAGTSPSAGDAETDIVPPATQPAPEQAWSREGPETEPAPLRQQSWGNAWTVAAAVVICGIVVAVAIGFAGRR